MSPRGALFFFSPACTTSAARLGRENKNIFFMNLSILDFEKLKKSKKVPKN